jgi:hypothetical protein
MRRFWLFFLVVVLAVGLAVPAFAEHEIGGFHRVKAWVSNYQAFNFGNLVARGASGNLAADPGTSAYVEQRARFKYSFSNNEFAKTVFYIEADNVWGDLEFNRAGATRNSGGGLGADTVAIEIKNLYTWFKIPDTDYQFQVGLQNFNDAYYGNFVGVNDMGGVLGKAKFDPVSLRFGWFKWFEGNAPQSASGAPSMTFRSDDLDFYLVEAKFKAMENLDLGLNVYFMNDDRNRAGNQSGTLGGTPNLGAGGSTTDIYIIGVNGNLKLDAVTLSGFFAYETGTVNAQTAGVTDRDIAAFAGNLRADLKLGPGDLFIEGMYQSGDDDGSDNDIEGWQVSPTVNSPFYYRADMQILFYNGDDETTATGMFTDGNQGGNADGKGVMAIMAGYKFKPSDNLQLKIGAGWAQDVEGNTTGAGLHTQEKSAIEVNGHVRYAITKGLTAGVEGAWASLSDVPTAADNTVEADDLYMAYARLNYSF